MRDGDQSHAILRQLADMEIELELVAEEAREALDEDQVELRRLLQRSVDHRLERGATIIGRSITGFDELGRCLPAALQAIAFDLAALIGN